MLKHSSALVGMALALASSSALATPFTTTSPTGGLLPSGVTAIGGIVLDVTGTNGTRVVSELAASDLFVGYSDSGSPSAYEGNPFTIGIQSGFTSTIISALGGGLQSASIRFTLFDGDSSPGNFDENEDTLVIGGVSFGNWSDVATQITDSNGTADLGDESGFPDSELATGFFSTTDSAALGALYSEIAAGSVTYQLNDNTPGDNFFDFTQGLDASLTDVGSPPVITPTGAPEPASLALLGGGLAGLGFLRRRRKA